MEAGIAGKTTLEALEAANAVSIAAGRAPIPEDVSLAQMEEIRRDPTHEIGKRLPIWKGVLT